MTNKYDEDFMVTLATHFGDEHEAILEAFEEAFGEPQSPENVIDAYSGQYKSEVDYAECFAEDIGMLDGMPENLRFYFDFEAFARDLFINDMAFSTDGHVFCRHW